MEALLVYLAQLSVPFALAWLVCRYLRDATRRLLADICGTEDRAEFWVRVMTVLTVAAPTIMVIIMGSTYNPFDGAWQAVRVGEMIRQAIGLSTAGIAIAVACLARVVWGQVDRASRRAPAAAVLPTEGA